MLHAGGGALSHVSKDAAGKQDNNVAYAVDVYGTCCYAATSLGTPVENLFENAGQEMIDLYRPRCMQRSGDHLLHLRL